ncbi:hypothetical protein ACP275_08G118900 [Erythranthe tilingii]
MPKIPRELTREVQIRTRADAGLSDYNPSDPTLPALPSLSAAIATTEPDPSRPDLRCKNCKGKLLRGSESIICVYCGLGPHYDVVPDPICFTSTAGYQWLLRSLRLNGSELVDPGNKGDQDQVQRSPKALTRLSDFLNFKIQWPIESDKDEITFSDKHSEETKRSSLSLPGVAPDKFFLNSKGNVLSDTSIEKSFIHNQFHTADRKDVAAFEDQNLFQNVQSSNPAESTSEHKITEAFSEWDADFQSADFENQHSGDKSSEQFVDSSASPGIKFQDPLSLDPSTGLKVDLTAEIDSVFGPGKDLNDGKLNDNPAASPAFDDWDWNNLSSNNSNFSGVIDATVSTKNGMEDDYGLEYSKNLSTGDDLFQDFQSPTTYPEMPENKTNVEERGLEYSKDLSIDDNLFQDFQSPTNYPDMAENKIDVEEHNKTMDEDLFEEWDDFTGSTSSQVASQSAWIGGEQKSSEMDFFSSNNDFAEADFDGFSQPNLFSTSTSNSNALTDTTSIVPEIPIWLSDGNEAAKNVVDASEKSTKDEVMMLISQMHDLSFMLDTNLSIPTGSDTHNSSAKD